MAPADTLVCDTAQVAAWQSDPAFAYSRELIAPEINVLEWFSRWFGKLLDKIFGNTLVAEYSEVVLICIAVLILVLVIWFVYKKRPELFMRSRKSTLPYTVGEDTIYGVDFAERIADALARTDYREAVVHSSGSFTKPKFWLLNIQASKAIFEMVPAIEANANATLRSIFPRPI